MGFINDIINSKVFESPAPPSDSWRLGTAQAAPDAGKAPIILDGDIAPVSIPYFCAPTAGARVLTLLLGRERMCVAVLGGDCRYKVGDLYLTTLTDDPSTTWPGTTWERYGMGRALVSLNPSDTDWDTVGETRGTKTHTLTTAEMPSHAHKPHQWSLIVANGGNSGTGSLTSGGYVNYFSADSNQERYGSSAGEGQAHDNIQPSVVVNVWRRTV